MWSLKAGLDFYKSHLPAGFDASHGIASLFPAGYTGSISPLKGYVFMEYARLATPYEVGTPQEYFGSAGDFWAMADGTGRWAWSWSWWPVELNTGYEREAGFVFNHSNDGRAHGYADTSHPSEQTKSCASGTDDWIAQHWPELFATGARLTLVEGSTPPTSQIWTDAGFGAGQFTGLQGGVLACADTLTGSTLFRYPNHPLQIPSLSGADIGTALHVARLVIERAVAKGITHAKSVNGYQFTLHYTAPAPGQPTVVSIDVSHSGSAVQGTADWQIESAGFQVNASLNGQVAAGQAGFNYTFEGDDAAPTGDRMSLTAVLAGSVGSQSQTTQTILGMALVGETTLSSQGGGPGQTSTFSIDASGALTTGGTNPPDPDTLGVAVLPAQQLLPGLVDGSVVALVSALADQIAGNTTTGSLTETYDGGPFGQVTVTGSVQTDGSGNITGQTITASSGPGAQVALVYTYTIDVTNTSNMSQAQGSMTYSPPDGQLTITWSNGLPGGAAVDTYTTTFTGLDGSSTSQSQTTTNGTVTAQSSTVTDSDGNTSTSSVTFGADGSFQINITTTDSAGNGTSETITGDASGNATSDVTTSVGAGATTPLGTGDGGGGNDDQGQDGDDGDDSDGDDDSDDED